MYDTYREHEKLKKMKRLLLLYFFICVMLHQYLITDDGHSKL